jgi:hypothetical protein
MKKKQYLIALVTFCFINSYAQNFRNIGDSLRQQGIKRIICIEIEEVDSMIFFKKKEKREINFPEYRAAFFYKQDGTIKNIYGGSLINIFGNFLHVPTAYIKTTGIIPKVFLRCTIGFRKSNEDDFLDVISLLERYYNCRLEKVRDSVDVLVIHKEFPDKLSTYERPDRIKSWTDTEGRILYQKQIMRLEGDKFLSTLTSHMSYTYKEIFVIADEDKSDENMYYMMMETKVNPVLDDAYKEMKDNGLRLTKEKKLIDFYRLTFQ